MLNMAGLKITKPDGTKIEIDQKALQAFTPEQLAALVHGAVTNEPVEEEENIIVRSIDEVAKGSRNDHVAFFLVNEFAPGVLLSTADIHKAWHELIASQSYDLLIEKSNMSTILTRLASRGLIQKIDSRRPIQWKLLDTLYQEYPVIESADAHSSIVNVITSSLNYS